jgi:hypothetical protein
VEKDPLIQLFASMGSTTGCLVDGRAANPRGTRRLLLLFRACRQAW